MRQRNQRHFMGILRDTLFKKALLFMEESDYLDRVMDGMNAHHTAPYSAVDEFVSKMMPDYVALRH